MEEEEEVEARSPLLLRLLLRAFLEFNCPPPRDTLFEEACVVELDSASNRIVAEEPSIDRAILCNCCDVYIRRPPPVL